MHESYVHHIIVGANHVVRPIRAAKRKTENGFFFSMVGSRLEKAWENANKMKREKVYATAKRWCSGSVCEMLVACVFILPAVYFPLCRISSNHRPSHTRPITKMHLSIALHRHLLVNKWEYDFRWNKSSCMFASSHCVVVAHSCCNHRHTMKQMDGIRHSAL